MFDASLIVAFKHLVTIHMVCLVKEKLIIISCLARAPALLGDRRPCVLFLPCLSLSAQDCMIEGRQMVMQCHCCKQTRSSLTRHVLIGGVVDQLLTKIIESEKELHLSVVLDVIGRMEAGEIEQLDADERKVGMRHCFARLSSVFSPARRCEG